MSSQDNVDKSMRAESGGANARASVDGVPPAYFLMVYTISTLSVVLSLAAFIGMFLAYKSLFNDLQLTQNEAKMLEMYVMESDARFVAHGYIKPEESYNSVRPKLFQQLQKEK